MKKLLIGVLLLLFTLSLTACTKPDEYNGDCVTGDEACIYFEEQKSASLSNPDEDYLVVDNIEISNQELWNKMKRTDGISYLIDYAKEIVLSDYISLVTDEQINDRIEYLTYYTNDADVIAEIKNDSIVDAQYTNQFRSTVVANGYNPDEPDSLNQFLLLDIAFEEYAKDLMNSTNPTTDYYVDEAEVSSFYNYYAKGDVCSLDLRFSSTNQLYDMMESYNLVLNYENSIVEYIGTDPIENVLISDFNDTNTTSLSNEEVFNYFVDIYNDLHPNAQITDGLYCTDYTDIAVKNYENLTENQSSYSPIVQYADYVFHQLELNDNVVPYSFEAETIGDFEYLVFKVSETEAPSYDELSATEKKEVRDELVSLYLTTERLAQMENDLLTSHNFTIYDFELKLQYAHGYDIAFDNNGDEQNIAMIANHDITPDDLFHYIEERVGSSFCLEIVKQQYLVNSDEFMELYGDDSDYINSENELIQEYVTDLKELKTLFDANSYAAYGYSSDDMTWGEFIFLAFGMVSENQLIEQLYLTRPIQIELQNDLIEYDKVYPYLQDRVDNYYSVKANHILLYIDFDNDFVPDDYYNYVDTLSTSEQTDLDNLLSSFNDLVQSKLNTDGYTFTQIKDEYNDVSMHDTMNEWYAYKEAGFILKLENLGDVDQDAGKNLVSSFDNSLRRLYEELKNSSEELLYDDQLTFTQFGVHLISVEEGIIFEQYTAATTENNNIVPSSEQIETYIIVRKSETLDEPYPFEFTIDDEFEAIRYYFSNLYEPLVSESAYSVFISDYIANNGTFKNDNDAKITHLELLAETVSDTIYPELYRNELD